MNIFWSRLPCRQTKNYDNLDASSFEKIEKHAVEIKRIPLWECIFLECVQYRHGDTDEEEISYAVSRYGGFRDAWFSRDRDVADVRELRTWRLIVMFSRSSDFSRWDLRCEFCLHVLMHSRSPVQEKSESSHFRCVHFLISTSISLTASVLSRSEDCNRIITVNTKRVSYLKVVMKKLWLRRILNICEKRQIMICDLRHTLNTKHWVQTGIGPKRQMSCTHDMINRAYYNSTE